jgi:phthalate 4,5-cis-dihydrodiol dehydrogenase
VSIQASGEPLLRLGMAGLGRAFSLMQPTFALHPRVEVVAAADPRPGARAQFAKEFAGRTYETVADLCDDPDVDVVYISTPHQFHAEHACLAAARGKHVLVEKPMALTLDECDAMIAAAERAGVALVVGHSQSFEPPILHARALIASGRFGALRMITSFNFTDFLYRPRRPEELDTARGGGVIFNQAPHQVDVARLLGGGLVRSVRALTGAWDAARPTEGAYAALLEFDSGAFATLTYSGYAHFDSDAFCDWIGESGQRKSAPAGANRPVLPAGAREIALKAQRNYGGENYAAPAEPVAHGHFGVVVASCDRADLRPVPQGVVIHGGAAPSLDQLAPPSVPRASVIDELHDVVHGRRPPLHDGRWALATMEVCLAILQSARLGRDVRLARQVAVQDFK